MTGQLKEKKKTRKLGKKRMLLMDDGRRQVTVTERGTAQVGAVSSEQ